MTKYLTTTQYRDLDEGIGTDINDLALSRLIARAESAVDTCMKFRLGIGGFEPHNVWIQQKWSDQSRQTAFPSYPVPVQKVNRYRIQVSNLSDGNGFLDRKSTRLNSSHLVISYAVFCLKKKKNKVGVQSTCQHVLK